MKKEFKITKEEIRQIHAVLHDGNTPIFDKQSLEKMFPEAFKEDKKELEVGNWYKSKLTPKTIINCQIFTENEKGGYGVHVNHWSENWGLLNFKDYVEATEQEVFEALKNEAVKRGFKEGVFIHRPFGTDLNDHVIDKNNFPDDGDFYYNLKDNYLECYGFVVFSKGQWAEIIPTITKEEAEKELGKKII